MMIHGDWCWIVQRIPGSIGGREPDKKNYLWRVLICMRSPIWDLLRAKFPVTW